MERLVASQLSDIGRVPALYAYLVNDARRLELSVNWDSRGYCLTPGALEAVGGPLGHAWRAARRSDRVHLTGAVISRADFSKAITEAARRAGGDPVGDLLPTASPTVFVCRIDAREDAAQALRLAERFASDGTPVILALEAGDADQWISAAQLGLRFDGVQVTRDTKDLLDRVRRAVPNGVMVVRGPAAEISAYDLRTLAEAAAEGVMAAPAWLDAVDGTIVSAGVGFRGGLGFDLLSGHPAEDLERLDPRLDVPAVRGHTRAIPPEAAHGSLILTRAVVRAPAAGTPSDDRAQLDTAVDDLLAATGFRVDGWTRGIPLLRRNRGTLVLDDGEEVPRLRWAIKIAAPPGPRGEWWGDTHFARGLAGALRRLGQEVVIDAYAARDRPSTHLDDVTLALRGPEPIHASEHNRSILWIISHPDEIGARDLAGYGAVFAASTVWARSASERFHVPITPLHQCTDARLFRPHGVGRSGGLVFVGTARGIARPSIIEPLRAGIPVSVYGPDWSGWIPGAAIKASGIPNAELPELYESAGAVLNDHWPAMQAAGFISNRLYDVVAAGGRVVSDDVAGIDAIFGGAVRTYHDIPELLELVRTDLDDLFPSSTELMRISDRIRHEHSFDARARTLLEVAREL